MDENFGLLDYSFNLPPVTGTAETFYKYIIAPSFLQNADACCARFIFAAVDEHAANLAHITQITKSQTT